MRLHFAAEIVLELVYQQADSIQKIGAHIAQDKAAALIEANLDILSTFSDPENEKRTWAKNESKFTSPEIRLPCLPF